MSDKSESKCIIVAELGINHNGDMDIAKKLIDAAKLAGCDYVKFQKRTVDLVYTKDELDKYRESPWGTTNREQKYGLEFGKKEYDEIDAYCQMKNIQWFASPWDCKSVEFITQYDIPFIKIASACITNFKLLEYIKMTAIPVILSTGMSTREEVYEAVNYLGKQVKYILACTSTYPTADNEMNLNFIKTLRKEFLHYIDIGFSNHHPGIFYSCVAAALGAKMIEFHLTLDRAMYGSDQAASIEIPGVFKIVKYIKGLEKAKGDGKWVVYESEEKIKEKLRGN
ncbi:MAG: N-acetylneuraminate synthase family protein [Candidatus Heimdallarchaeaceae archaeon]